MTQQITLIKDKILSDNYFTLHNITYDLTRKDGEVIRHKREVYDRGNGATILLYNAKKKTVVLIRQFRVATWVNGNESGQLIETCAGLLDNDEPEVCIRNTLPRGLVMAKKRSMPTTQIVHMLTNTQQTCQKFTTGQRKCQNI